MLLLLKLFQLRDANNEGATERAQKFMLGFFRSPYLKILH